MKERPILFSSPMVRAILEGRKSQTRRIIKPQPVIDYESGWVFWKNHQWDIHGYPLTYDILNVCPYGKPGDTLYVKETYTIFEPEHCEGMSERFYYKADHHPLNEEWRQEMISHGYPYKWKSGLFMRKSASRIKLKVTNIRVERVQDITEEDAIAEGIITNCEPKLSRTGSGEVFYNEGDYPTDHYQRLWESINGKGSWEKNPFVWIIEFEKL